tara:strand:- start:129 stop:401 length:273 start_codon:yes stop_codon:yes gene_type:complete
MNKLQQRKALEKLFHRVLAHLTSEQSQMISRRLYDIEMANRHFGLNSQVDANIAFSNEIEPIVSSLHDYTVDNFFGFFNLTIAPKLTETK